MRSRTESSKDRNGKQDEIFKPGTSEVGLLSLSHSQTSGQEMGLAEKIRA